MKTIAKLLMVVTQLAIRCRADLPWQLFEHFKFNDDLVGWSGEDNLMLMKKTAKSTSLGSDHHHLSPQPTHATSHCTSTTTPGSEPLPRRTDLVGINFNHAMEDHVLRPVASPHDIDSPPMIFDSPPMEFDSPTMEINSPPLELEEEITQPDVGAVVDHIPMNEQEVPEYQLVFHEGVFSASLTDGQPFKDKWQKIVQAIKVTSGGGQLPVLAVTGNAVDFIRNFNYSSVSKQKVDRKKRPKSKDIAREYMKSCLSNSRTWRTVYKKRLGINFGTANNWFQDIIQRESPNSVKQILPKIKEWFLIYIILVDMIVTILPNGNCRGQWPVDRIQSFQTAIRCFEDYTRLTLRSPTGFGNTKPQMRSAIIWKFITHWKENDENYAWLQLTQASRGRLSWKMFFQLIFSYSIEHFTEKFETVLDSEVSH